MIIVMYRFIILSTSYLIPQYLTTLQNFRSLQVGDVLLWIAVPQFILAPLIAWMLQYIDPRYVLALGVTAVGIACLMASNLTAEWATGDFLPSQILQAFGQSAALISVVLFAVRHLQPADALTFGAVLQTGRLFGGEVGNAFMQTYVRVREQVQSNLLGQHVGPAGYLTQERLSEYTGGVLARSDGPAAASARAMSLLAQAVRNQASVLSYIDGFTIVSITAIVMLGLVMLLREAPFPPAATRR